MTRDGQDEDRPGPGAAAREETLMLGVVLVRQPAASRWASHVWRVGGLLPRPAGGPVIPDWTELHRQGDEVSFHAATLPLTLHRTETEDYATALSGTPPTLWVVLRETVPGAAHPLKVHLVTASPFEAQDYLESGEDIVEPVAMPPEIGAWISAFVEAHDLPEPFRKRKRKRDKAATPEPGRDSRIAQARDVFLTPAELRARRAEDTGDTGGTGADTPADRPEHGA